MKNRLFVGTVKYDYFLNGNSSFKNCSCELGVLFFKLNEEMYLRLGNKKIYYSHGDVSVIEDSLMPYSECYEYSKSKAVIKALIRKREL